MARYDFTLVLGPGQGVAIALETAGEPERGPTTIKAKLLGTVLPRSGGFLVKEDGTFKIDFRQAFKVNPSPTGQSISGTLAGKLGRTGATGTYKGADGRTSKLWKATRVDTPPPEQVAPFIDPNAAPEGQAEPPTVAPVVPRTPPNLGIPPTLRGQTGAPPLTLNLGQETAEPDIDVGDDVDDDLGVTPPPQAPPQPETVVVHRRKKHSGAKVAGFLGLAALIGGAAAYLVSRD